jgi:hypothetical protein
MEVVLVLDETGHVTSAKPRGAPPKALASLLRRTMIMMEAGTFTVRGGLSGAGTEILEVRATVSEVSAEESASPYSLGNPDPGTASFTQQNGRHVEVKVRVIRVEDR